MDPREDAVKNRSIAIDREPFKLDVLVYKNMYDAQELFSEEYKKNLKYPDMYFAFYPRYGVSLLIFFTLETVG